MARVQRLRPRGRLDRASSSNVFRGGLALADQLVASATNFLTGIIIGRACSQEDFGLYMLGLSFVLFAVRLQNSLISTPYMVYFPRLKEDARAEYTGSTLLHQLGMSAAGAVLLAVAGSFLSFGIGPPGLEQVIWALAVTLSFILLREYARNVCFANLDFAKAVGLDLSIAVVQTVGLLYLWYSGRLSVGSAFWTIGFACAVAVIAWLVLVRRSFSLRFDRVAFDVERNWEFGKWIFASGILWETCIYLYPWVLTYFHGTASTGVWAACFGAASIVNPVILGVSNFLGPRIAHAYADGGTAELQRFLLTATVVFSLLILPFSIGLLFAGGFLVELLYGAKYSGHGLVVGLLAINLLTIPIGFTISRALFAMERAALDSLTNLTPLIVLAVIGVWLVKSLGTVGVALGLFIGDVAVVVAKLAVFLPLVREDSSRIAP